MFKTTSVFTAEAYGILLVENHILLNQVPKLVIYNDSWSIMWELSSQKSEKNVVNLLIINTMSAYALNFEVSVCWVQGRSWIAGNKSAHRMAAAAALRTAVDITTIP